MKAVISREAAEEMRDLSLEDLAQIEAITQRVAEVDDPEVIIKEYKFSRILARTPEGRQIYLARIADLRLLFTISEDEVRSPVFILLDISTGRPEASATNDSAQYSAGLTSGAPIESLDKDSLGRARLAKTLSTALTQYGSQQSLVVGINGPWGSGKTSLLNMAAAAIQSNEDAKADPIVTRFNPWNFSNQDQLVAEFFDTLSSAVNRPDLGSKYERASELISNFGKRLRPFSALDPYGKLIDFALKGTEVLAKGLKREADDLRSLDSVKAEISRALSVLDRRLIVIIDDIDRLTNEEVRRLFQLVKATADFSNVIYLMAFDKNIVVKALETEQGRTGDSYGEAYLDKIVNVPIDVPPLTSVQVQRLLINRLNIFVSRNPDYFWSPSNQRLVEMIGFQQKVFKTVRSLDRFANLLAFSEPLVSGEVDYIDYMEILTLQTLLPSLYYFIRDNPDLFIDTTENIMLRNDRRNADQRAAIDAAIEAFKGGIDANDLRDVLVDLFPRLSSLYRRTESSDDEKTKWVLERRIGSSLENFHVYFQLEAPEDTLSARRMLSLLENLEQNSLRISIESLIAENRAIAFLGELKMHRDDPIIQRHLADIILVLFDLGDRFSRDIRGFPFKLDGHTLIMQIVYQFLSRVQDENARFEYLMNAVTQASQGLYSLVTQISVEDQAHGKFNLGGSGNKAHWLVSDEHLALLEQVALAKIRGWAADGRLASHPELPYILFRWKNWGPDTGLAEFVLNSLDDRNFLRVVAKLVESASQMRFGSIAPLSESGVGELAPLDAIEHRIKSIVDHKTAGLSDASRNDLNVIVKSIS